MKFFFFSPIVLRILQLLIHLFNSGGVFNQLYLSKWVLQSNRKLKMWHVWLLTDFPRSHHIYWFWLFCVSGDSNRPKATPMRTRPYYDKEHQHHYIMDAKFIGNLGRYLNVSRVREVIKAFCVLGHPKILAFGYYVLIDNKVKTNP